MINIAFIWEFVMLCCVVIFHKEVGENHVLIFYHVKSLLICNSFKSYLFLNIECKIYFLLDGDEIINYSSGYVIFFKDHLLDNDLKSCVVHLSHELFVLKCGEQENEIWLILLSRVLCEEYMYIYSNVFVCDIIFLIEKFDNKDDVQIEVWLRLFMILDHCENVEGDRLWAHLLVINITLPIPMAYIHCNAYEVESLDS